MKVLELYCGIGGCAAAVGGQHVVGSLDQSGPALQVHRLNFPESRSLECNLEDATSEYLAGFGADLWWMSPPCQPYTVKGLRRDLADSRALSFVRMLGHVESVRPASLAVENVAGFVDSEARVRLLEILSRSGYSVAERLLCPTELGVPSRRLRYYLVASRTGLSAAASDWRVEERPVHAGRWSRPLAEYLDPEDRVPEAAYLDDGKVRRFGSGLRILDPSDPTAYTTCFTSGYSRLLVRSGAYLRSGGRVRRFTPAELLRLLHFPEGFRFPEALPLVKRWHLAGNSLSVVAVREVLKALRA